MLSAQVRSVLFDFGGTLDSDGVRWSLRFHTAYREAGGVTGFQEFEPAFRASDELLLGECARKQLGFEALIERQAELVLELLGEGAPIDSTAMAAHFVSDTRRTISRNRGMLERFAERMPLGIVSNFSGNLVICLAELDLLQLFTTVVDSGVLKISKPDPRIFQSALAECQAQPAHVLMVGDHPRNDILPALQLGMQACWIAPPGAPSDSAIDGSSRITSLLELEALLA